VASAVGEGSIAISFVHRALAESLECASGTSAGDDSVAKDQS
jgi:hypothetical protein